MPEFSPFLQAGADGLVKIGILEQELGLVDKGKRRLSRRCLSHPVHEVFDPHGSSAQTGPNRFRARAATR